MSAKESDNQAALTDLGERLSRVAQIDAPVARALARVRSTIGLRVAGQQVVLELGPAGNTVTRGSSPCEIQVDLTASFAADFASGRRTLLDGLLSGQAHASGPVGAVLDVAPIMRLLLHVVGDGARHPPTAAGHESPTRQSEVQHERDGHQPTLGAETIALEAHDLHSRSTDGVAVRGADLRVYIGAVTAVLGPSRAGKTLLLNHLLGADAARSGTVSLLGRPLASMRPTERAAARRLVGVVPQHVALPEHLTVQAIVAAAVRTADPSAGEQAMHVALTHLEGLTLGRLALHHPHELTNVNRAKVAFARATVTKPRIIVVDCPEAGLDPIRTVILCHFIRDYHDDTGGTVLALTSDPLIVSRLADFVTLMVDGSTRGGGDVHSVLESERDFVADLHRSRQRGPGPHA